MTTATTDALATITFTLNGRRRTVQVPPMKRLLDVLREDCGHTGTKEGCGEGECGACTVLLNGMAVNSCLIPAVQADGARLLTVEGLAHGTALTALQRAFVELGGAQCGICTPGMLISAHELITRSPGRVPSEQEVRDALAGNLCRCTGYQKIVEAVRAAARTDARKKRETPEPRRLPGRSKPKRKDAPGPKRRPRKKRAPGRKKASGATGPKRRARRAEPKPKRASAPAKRTARGAQAKKRAATPKRRTARKAAAKRAPRGRR